ncbi:MAG: phage holin family protein [Bacteroidetes bacterium]|nr:phage holin family protein [Bacteroidota bacterium]
MRFIFQLTISTLAIFVTSLLLPGVHVDTILTAIIVAAVLAFLNSVVKPFMILLTIPVTIFSFGIFLLFINAFVILIADRIVDGFEIDGFGWAFLFGIVQWVVTIVFENLNNTNLPKNE